MISSPFPRTRPGVTVPAILLAAGLLAVAPARSEETARLYVHLETPGRFQYSGDPTQVSILFKNEGNAPWINPGMDIEAGFDVYDSDGKKLEKTKVPSSPREAQPKILEPNAYFGKIVGLSELFPRIAGLGTYRITWSAPGIPEQSVVTRIIKKFDPARDYQAVIDTEFGKVVLEFYRELAPFHVKNFIDLTNLGFYDGLLFHRVVKGEMVIGGSPTADERGSPGYNIPAEPNDLKVLPGTLSQVRNNQTGADESGCIFMIATAAQPDLDRRVTVFGRVVEGLETVKAISNLPTIGGGAGRVPSRPIKDVVIRKIEIREKKTAKAS